MKYKERSKYFNAAFRNELATIDKNSYSFIKSKYRDIEEEAYILNFDEFNYKKKLSPKHIELFKPIIEEETYRKYLYKNFGIKNPEEYYLTFDIIIVYPSVEIVSRAFVSENHGTHIMALQGDNPFSFLKKENDKFIDDHKLAKKTNDIFINTKETDRIYLKADITELTKLLLIVVKKHI